MQDDPISLVSKGKRLKSLREFSGITSLEMADIAGVSKSSISYWENAARGGLTRKGAEKIIAGMLKYGIQCELSWLWFGEGPEPTLIQNNLQAIKEKSLIDCNQKLSNSGPISPVFMTIEKEIEFFLRINQNAVVAKLEDNLMHPQFSPSDIVGGIWQNSSFIFDEKVCIIRCEDILRVRIIKKIKENIEIMHINQQTEEYLNVNKIDFSEIAPVIRLWRY